jgi:NAD+ kinase
LNRPRVIIIRNPAKPDAEARLATLVDGLRPHAAVVGSGIVADTRTLMKESPDRIVVLGGDGTILATVRELGERQVPIIGVNFGKLGFLAEFSLEEVASFSEAILADPKLVSRRMMIEARIQSGERCVATILAVNDVVLHGGPPYRMIDLSITVDDDHLTQFSGDGLILATPCGSTAHNMSVGGPIVQSEIAAIVITPISPHSLTHRPMVVAGNVRIQVRAQQVNEGTAVVADGQQTLPLRAGDALDVARYPHDFQLIHNPAQPRWYTLTKKLRWGQ